MKIENVSVPKFHEYIGNAGLDTNFTIEWAGNEPLDLEGTGTILNIFLHPKPGAMIPLNLEETQELYEQWLSSEG